MSRSKAACLVVLIVSAGLALRLFRLTAPSMWYDEAFSWRISQPSFPEVVGRAAQDTHPPFYFLLLKFWTVVFGDSVLAMRSLSALLGTGTIVFMYLFMHEAFPKSGFAKKSDIQKTDKACRFSGLAAFAATLVAVSVFQVRWSREVRMYVLGAALAVLSSGILFRAIHADRRRMYKWLAYAGVTLLFAYTHYYALFSIFAQFLFLFGYGVARFVVGERADGRRLLGYTTLAGIFLILGWWVWLPVFLDQSARVQGGFWIRPFSTWDIPIACYQMFIDPKTVLDPKLAGFGQSAPLTVCGICALAILFLLRKSRAGDWYLACSATVPILLGALMSALRTEIFYFRYLIFAHLFLLAAVARTVWSIPSATVRKLSAAALTLMGVWLCVLYWQDLDVENRPGMKGAMAYIENSGRRHEPILVASPPFHYSALYYGKDRVLLQRAVTDASQIGSDRFWAVGRRGGAWIDEFVSVTEEWVKVNEKSFPESHRLFGEAVVREYRRSAKPKTGRVRNKTSGRGSLSSRSVMRVDR